MHQQAAFKSKIERFYLAGNICKQGRVHRMNWFEKSQNNHAHSMYAS